MKLSNTAIIGSYASDKLFISGFDVQRTNERSLQQTKTRKVVGDARQNIKITLEGRLTCTTFEELDTETQALLDALNKKTLLLVIGATPDRFYRVSWSGAGLAHRAGQGGPNLPFSLDFDCLDEGAFVGLPVAYAGASLPGVPFMVSHLGKPVEPVELQDFKSFFSVGRRLWNSQDGTGLQVSGDTLSLSLSGSVVSTWKIPAKSSYNLGLVFQEDKTIAYLDGRSYTHNQAYDNYSWVFDATGNTAFGAFPFVTSPEYMSYIAQSSNSYIIQGEKLEGDTLSLRYYGAENTPVSIYAESNVSYNALTFGDFGARCSSKSKGWFNFNTLEGSITSDVSENLDNISYNGRFTLLPRLKKGMNTLIRTSGDGEVYIFWREMVR